MPFSFKPDISQSQSQGGAPLAPTASFGTSSTQNLASRKVEQGKSFVQFLLMAAFGLSLVCSLGLFGYKYYLSSQIENKKATLASYESQLADFPLEDMRKLSNRIKIINQLVREHPSANVAFRIIEDSVENQVTYKRFDLRFGETTKAYQLTLDGSAPDYKGVAQQVDTLKRKPYTTYIQNTIVEGLQPDISGKINFTLKMPIVIAGLFPETLNLSDGAAARMASSTPLMVEVETATSTATSSTPSRP